jgi:hypothetical protein
MALLWLRVVLMSSLLTEILEMFFITELNTLKDYLPRLVLLFVPRKVLFLSRMERKSPLLLR